MKRIGIDPDAYHALCRHRSAGQSSSDVIETSTLDEVDRIIAARGADPASGPDL